MQTNRDDVAIKYELQLTTSQKDADLEQYVKRNKRTFC